MNFLMKYFVIGFLFLFVAGMFYWVVKTIYFLTFVRWRCKNETEGFITGYDSLQENFYEVRFRYSVFGAEYNGVTQCATKDKDKLLAEGVVKIKYNQSKPSECYVPGNSYYGVSLIWAIVAIIMFGMALWLMLTQ